MSHLWVFCESFVSLLRVFCESFVSPMGNWSHTYLNTLRSEHWTWLLRKFFVSPYWILSLLLWVLSPFHLTHCSHLDIYISQKTGSVCSEFVRPISNEPRGQTYQFFDLTIQIYYSHFSSIFCRNCQIQCFLDTANAISKRLKYLSHVFS